MTKKQKKLNKMTDMSLLTTRRSHEYYEQLQRSRLIRNVTKSEIGEKISQTLAPVSKKISFIAERIHPFNLPPKKSRKKSAFFSAFSLKLISPLTIFLIVGMVLASAFPLLQLAEKDRRSQAAVLGAATSAYDELLGAKAAFFSSDFDAAGISLTTAYERLDEALKSLNNLSVLARSFPAVTTGENLLFAAQEATLGIQYLSSSFQKFSELQISSRGFATGEENSLEEHFSDIRNDFLVSANYFENAILALESLDLDALPGEVSLKTTTTLRELSVLSESIESMVSLQELFFSLLAVDESKKYLVLFQNNRELRATGGFIGTVGLLDLSDGQIKSFKIESVYNPDGQLVERIAPPGPLSKTLTDRWGLRDSNWFFDFPKSARKAVDFYELETGIRADGVFAFTPDIFVEFLKLTGPIEVPGYDVVLTADNFVEEVQYQTSVVYDRQLNQPKKFLADFTPLLLDRLGEVAGERWFDVFGIFTRSLARKDIQLFSFDELTQKGFQDFEWSGEIVATEGDYLAVVNSNVGAGKTDQNINQEIDLHTEILKDGSHKNTLTVTRTHLPGTEKEFPVNVDFMRIFVPEGSELISASGFDNYEFYPSEQIGAKADLELEQIDKITKVDAVSNTLIYKESGKTVFANWLSLPPGETRKAVIQYVTPDLKSINLDGSELYSLLVQKQPGAPRTLLTINLTLTPDHKPVYVNPPESVIYEDRIEITSDLDTDEVFAVILEKD